MHTSGSPQLCFLRRDIYIKPDQHSQTAQLKYFSHSRAPAGDFTVIMSRKVGESGNGTYLLCLTAATRSGPENMENRLSPLAEDVSSLELAESP